MVFDEQNNQFVLYGGHNGETVFGDTWFYKKEKWLEVTNKKGLKRIKNSH